MLSVLHTESSMNLGGQELRVLAEMEGLIGRGYRSALVARPGSRILGEAMARGLEAFPVRMRGSFDPPAVIGIARIMRRLGVKALNAHGSKDGWSAGLAARLLGIPVVRSRHVANPIRRHFFGRMVYGPLCDIVVTTSESIKQDMALRGVDPGKIISVPTGIDTNVFHPGVPRGSLRNELGIGPDAPLVGMVAVLRGDKGPDVFVRAADVVLENMPKAFFVLAGDGWMRPKLEEMLAGCAHGNRIILLGYRRDIPAVLSDLDIMVLPAKAAEGVPQAVLQAHAMKVPVIASKVGGISEVAVDGRTALSVPPGDHLALSSAIMELLRDRPQAQRLAEYGHRLVTERYTLEAMLDTMDGIYRKIAAAS